MIFSDGQALTAELRSDYRNTDIPNVTVISL